MDSWKSLLIVFALTALCSLALLNGIGILQINNGVNNTIFTSPALQQFNSTVYSNLVSLNDSSREYKSALDNETGTDVSYQGAITLGTIYHSITTFSGFIYAFATSFFYMIGQQLGVSPIVTITLMSILIIIVILLFWRLYKAGS